MKIYEVVHALQVAGHSHCQEQVGNMERAKLGAYLRQRGHVELPAVAAEAHEALPRPHDVPQAHLRDQLDRAAERGVQEVPAAQPVPAALVDVGRQVAGRECGELVAAELEQVDVEQRPAAGGREEPHDARQRRELRLVAEFHRDHGHEVAQRQAEPRGGERLGQVGQLVAARPLAGKSEAPLHQRLRLLRVHLARGALPPNEVDRLPQVQLVDGWAGGPAASGGHLGRWSAPFTARSWWGSGRRLV
mmetsp:Transcript_101368/g.302288  ORF Transcript_101368/g.302288 Transcript_101368/m.302288 type:complete len:247 (+) Transcript_101368:1629-2369(+)